MINSADHRGNCRWEERLPPRDPASLFFDDSTFLELNLEDVDLPPEAADVPQSPVALDETQEPAIATGAIAEGDLVFLPAAEDIALAFRSTADKSGQISPGLEDGGVPEAAVGMQLPSSCPHCGRQCAGGPRMIVGGDPGDISAKELGRQKLRKKQRGSNPIGMWQSWYGYVGPPYCKSCSESFRSHLLQTARRPRSGCTRELPCCHCAKILSHFNCSPAEVFAEYDTRRAKRLARATPKRQQLQHGSVDATADTTSDSCTPESEYEALPAANGLAQPAVAGADGQNKFSGEEEEPLSPPPSLLRSTQAIKRRKLITSPAIGIGISMLALLHILLAPHTQLTNPAMTGASDENGEVGAPSNETGSWGQAAQPGNVTRPSNLINLTSPELVQQWRDFSGSAKKQRCKRYHQATPCKPLGYEISEAIESGECGAHAWAALQTTTGWNRLSAVPFLLRLSRGIGMLLGTAILLLALSYVDGYSYCRTLLRRRPQCCRRSHSPSSRLPPQVPAEAYGLGAMGDSHSSQSRRVVKWRLGYRCCERQCGAAHRARWLMACAAFCAFYVSFFTILTLVFWGTA